MSETKDKDGSRISAQAEDAEAAQEKEPQGSACSSPEDDDRGDGCWNHPNRICLCRGNKHMKRKKQKKKKYDKVDIPWSGLPTTYEPCVHLHFKTKTVSRGELTQDEYADLLATPKGYEWQSEPTKKTIRKRRKMNRRKARKARRARRCHKRKTGEVFASSLMTEMWDRMTPDLKDKMVELMTGEFGMEENEADKIIKRAKICRCTRKKRRKPVISIRNTWVKEFSKICAENITEYIVAMLTKKRSHRVNKIAETILEKLCDITGEKTSMQSPKRRIHRLMVLLSYRLAMWLDDAFKESKKKKLKPKEESEYDETSEEEGETTVQPTPGETSAQPTPAESRPDTAQEESPPPPPPEAEEPAEDTEPTPGEPEPAPEESEPTSEEPEPAPEEPEPAPEEPEPAPEEPEPAPEEPEPAPVEAPPAEPEAPPEETAPPPAEEEAPPEETPPPPAEEEAPPEETAPPPAEEEAPPEETAPPPEDETPEEQTEEPLEEQPEEQTEELTTDEPKEEEEGEEEKEEGEKEEGETEEGETEEIKEEEEKEPSETKSARSKPSEAPSGDKKESIDVKVESIKSEKEPSIKIIDEHGVIQEAIIIKEEKKITCSPGVTYAIKRGDKDKITVSKVSSTTIAEKVALARNREVPVRGLRAPKTLSPVNSASMKEWSMWANNVAEMAEEWNNWIEMTIQDVKKNAEAMRSKDREPKKPTTAEKLEWKKWNEKKAMETMGYRVQKKKIQDAAKMWGKKILVKPAQQTKEEVIQVTELQSQKSDTKPARLSDGAVY